MLSQDNHESPDHRLRIVTLTDTLGFGGAEHVAQWLASEFAATHLDSTLVISRSFARGESSETERKTLERLEAAGVHVIQLGRRRKMDIGAWPRFTRFLRENHVDVLHAHKFGSNVWAALLGRAGNVPVVLAHEHSWGLGRSLPRRLLDRYLIAPRVSRFIAVSHEDRRRMVEIEHIDPSRIFLLPNGIPDRTPTPGRDVRSELGIPRAAPVVGIVASLTPVKAIDVLIRAAADLVPRHPDLRVLITGDGPERGALQDLIIRLNLNHAVRLLGPRADVRDVLTAVDIGVCCSTSEGSPLSVLEYMQQGLPVVATAVGGVPDLIEHGVNGLLVPPRSPDALASAIATLLADREQMRVMGKRAQERQRSEHTLGLLVRRLERLYVDLLAGRAPTPAASPLDQAVHDTTSLN